jgi:hypothetical protein
MEPILLGNVPSRLDTLELFLLVIYVYTIFFESINVLQVSDFKLFLAQIFFIIIKYSPIEQGHIIILEKSYPC